MAQTNGSLLGNRHLGLGRQVLGEFAAVRIRHDGRRLVQRVLHTAGASSVTASSCRNVVQASRNTHLHAAGCRHAAAIRIKRADAGRSGRPWGGRSGSRRGRRRGRRPGGRRRRGSGPCARRGHDILQLLVLVEAKVGIVFCLDLLEALVSVVHLGRGARCVRAACLMALVGHLLTHALQLRRVGGFKGQQPREDASGGPCKLGRRR